MQFGYVNLNTDILFPWIQVTLMGYQQEATAKEVMAGLGKE